MEKIMWLVLGGTAFVAALRAGQSSRARYIGRWAIGILFVVFGSVVNGVYLATGADYYEGFAKPAPFAFVRDTWESLVLPNQGFFISLLILADETKAYSSSWEGGGPRLVRSPSSGSTSGNCFSAESCGSGLL